MPMLHVIRDLVEAIEHKVMLIRLDRTNQLATTLLLKQRTRQLDAVVELAEAAGAVAA